MPAEYSSSAIWVFQSPVAFSLDPGNYVFDVAGNKAGGSVLQYQLAVTAVPLPASAFMFGAGLLVIGGLAARRKRSDGTGDLTLDRRSGAVSCAAADAKLIGPCAMRFGSQVDPSSAFT